MLRPGLVHIITDNDDSGHTLKDRDFFFFTLLEQELQVCHCPLCLAKLVFFFFFFFKWGVGSCAAVD
jgi:hypothetical protein